MKPIQFYTIKSSGGLKVEISNLGAKITKLLVANRKGEVKDVILGFRSADEWRTKETYFNAICGRVANRIKDGKITVIDEEGELQDGEYELSSDGKYVTVTASGQGMKFKRM